ncbi:MAG: hypothetical protein IKY94_13295 [Lachnospiraceae bacterium]|nr:hypothetical protein [Lachnospiraceae bacterium]
MKKFFSVAIIIVLISVLSGCAGNNDEGAKVQEDVVTEQVENTEVEAEEESVPVEQETTDEEAAEVAEEETTASSEKVDSEDAEKAAEPEVVEGQHTFNGKNGTYLLTYDPEKIEIKSGSAKPIERIGDVRAGVNFSMETNYASAQEYVDEYVQFLKEMDEQEEIERYDAIKVSPITQEQIGNVVVEFYTLTIEGMVMGVEETTENTYAFINLGTGDCMMIWDYYYDKNAEETGVDFKELLSWVILNLEVVE